MKLFTRKALLTNEGTRTAVHCGLLVFGSAGDSIVTLALATFATLITYVYAPYQNRHVTIKQLQDTVGDAIQLSEFLFNATTQGSTQKEKVETKKNELEALQASLGSLQTAQEKQSVLYHTYQWRHKHLSKNQLATMNTMLLCLPLLFHLTTKIAEPDDAENTRETSANLSLTFYFYVAAYALASLGLTLSYVFDNLEAQLRAVDQQLKAIVTELLNVMETLPAADKINAQLKGFITAQNNEWTQRLTQLRTATETRVAELLEEEIPVTEDTKRDEENLIDNFIIKPLSNIKGRLAGAESNTKEKQALCDEFANEIVERIHTWMKENETEIDTALKGKILEIQEEIQSDPPNLERLQTLIARFENVEHETAAPLYTGLRRRFGLAPINIQHILAALLEFYHDSNFKRVITMTEIQEDENDEITQIIGDVVNSVPELLDFILADKIASVRKTTLNTILTSINELIQTKRGLISDADQVLRGLNELRDNRDKIDPPRP